MRASALCLRTQSAFAAVSFLMLIAVVLQLSLIPKNDWDYLRGKLLCTSSSSHPQRRFSLPQNFSLALRRVSSSEVPTLAETLSGSDLSSSGDLTHDQAPLTDSLHSWDISSAEEETEGWCEEVIVQQGKPKLE